MRGRAVVLIGVFASAVAAKTVQVPFVGCASTVQLDDLEAPQARNKVFRPSVARSMAYYKASVAPGALAPRGWHYIGFYGSSGAELYVTQEPFDPTCIWSLSWRQANEKKRATG